MTTIIETIFSIILLASFLVLFVPLADEMIERMGD